MDRRQLKSMGVAAPGYGNAFFMDEGDAARADGVAFARIAGVATVFATDSSAAPIEATQRSFATDAEAFDYMFRCLRDSVAARRATTETVVEATEKAAAQQRPSLHERYRDLGLSGVTATLVWIATALGWLWISPFTYTRDDMVGLAVNGSRVGDYIFDADTGLVVVAVCYSLAVVHMADQWSLGRRDPGQVGRRALGTAIGTAVFSALALACMAIRSDEIDNPLYWLPPALALLSAGVVAVSLTASRTKT
ncbi:hypothetical protein [Aeromicrobium sp. Leaf350]|uniref:hypothetical protein n=1 Tax=Aeromicrobium sp. Leaf350 TaxID=2876565 RepID=UPI001E4DC809|nr:hypothetical protein [Aeromicrobium sp. Leaf350]